MTSIDKKILAKPGSKITTKADYEIRPVLNAVEQESIPFGGKVGQIVFRDTRGAWINFEEEQPFLHDLRGLLKTPSGFILVWDDFDII